MDQACLSHEEKTQVSLVCEAGGRIPIAGYLLPIKKEAKLSMSVLFPYRQDELIFLLLICG